VHFLLSTFLNVSHHFPDQRVFISHFTCFSVFLSYSMSLSLHFSFSSFSVFIALFHLLQCIFLIFHDFQFSCHIPGPTVCISHFPPFQCFSPYSRSKMFVSHFPRFSVFLSYCMSYSVNFSFSLFSVFLAIFQLLKCVFLISHDF